MARKLPKSPTWGQGMPVTSRDADVWIGNTVAADRRNQQEFLKRRQRR